MDQSKTKVISLQNNHIVSIDLNACIQIKVLQFEVLHLKH